MGHNRTSGYSGKRSVGPSTRSSICPSIPLFPLSIPFTSLCPSLCLFVCPSIPPSLHLSVHQFVRLLVCLSRGFQDSSLVAPFFFFTVFAWQSLKSRFCFYVGGFPVFILVSYYSLLWALRNSVVFMC